MVNIPRRVAYREGGHVVVELCEGLDLASASIAP